MNGNADAFHRKVENERQQHRKGFTKVEGEIQFSLAFNEISGDAATPAVLLQVLARQPYPPNAKERKRLEKIGMWPRKPEEFSFPLREAPHHGLTEKALGKALRRLHDVGFIDRLYAGSAMRKGDFARYILSERWRKWGKPDFQAVPWPKAHSIGHRDQDGKFIRSRGRKVLVAAISAATKSALTANSAATYPPVAAKNAVNEPISTPLVAAKSAVLLSSPVLDPNPRDGKKVQGKRKSNSGQSRRDDAQPSNSKLKLSDLRKQVRDVLLRNLPEGHVVNDSYAVSQLWDVHKQRLDVAKVRASFSTTFDNIITNDLFVLIGVNGSRPKIRFAMPKVLTWAGTPAQYRELLSAWGTT